MALLPVSDALAKILSGARPLHEESISLNCGFGRVLSRPITANRSQPPFDASAMDGYAVRAADIMHIPAALQLVGTSAAGSGFRGIVGMREAVRIFTGAPVPQGADTVVIQENTRQATGGGIEIVEHTPAGKNIRRAGLDFKAGDTLLEAGRVLDPAALALSAAANHAEIPVWRKPRIAIIATGDELVLPGNMPGPDQIIASNTFGVAAIITQSGGEVLDFGILPDRLDAIGQAVADALAADADVIVTLGGASVGDHDLAHAALRSKGLELDFWKIAMRPGKPLMFGRIGETRCLGLPGNPVSCLVCSHLFLKPLVRALAGLPPVSDEYTAVLQTNMPANDMRQDYVRAIIEHKNDRLMAAPCPVQDSSMLNMFANANGLIIRPPFAPDAKAGDSCRVLMLR